MPETVSAQCLNCGSDLNGPFCSYCGQKDADPNIGLGEMFGEFAGGLFSFDSRIYRTWKLLILKPGALTADYIAGKRVSQVPPFKLYLFNTVVAIFLLSMVDTGMFKVRTVPPRTPSVQNGAPTGENPDAGQREDGDPALQPASAQDADSQEDQSHSNREVTAEEGARGGFWLMRRFRQGMKRSQQDPQKVSKHMVQAIPKAMFLLLPLFALMLRVCYWNHRFNYPHWFVFSLHFHSFVFFLLMLSAIFMGLDLKILVRLLVAVGVPVYLFLSLRRVTGEAWWITLIKLIFFNLIYLVAVIIAMLIIATWTIITF